jgi:large-conductance mechanosensitive channel
MKNIFREYRFFFLLLLIATNSVLPDYAIGLMNKSSDILFYLGLILIFVYYAIIGWAIYLVVLDIRDFWIERKGQIQEEETENNTENE